jgi:D-glycero-alpha-D-manno-heptose-7-phosphate kinase
MPKKTHKNFVYVRAPLRLSLAGGGTDFPEYFENHDGTVICSVALDFYVHVNVRKLSELYDEKYRLEYYEVEHCDSIGEIKNDIIRGVFTLLSWDIPVHVSVVSDVPSSSGLGSSSAFAVALILALKRLRDGITASSAELVAMAIEVELDILGRSMGVQDCLPAAYGGLRVFQLKSRADIENEPVPLAKLEELTNKNRIAMIWTGGQRNSSTVLHEQRDRIPEYYKSYNLIKQGAMRLRMEMLNSSSAESLLTCLIDVINISQREKKKLSSKVISEKSADLMAQLKSMDIDAQRVIGAGNGGFILAASRKPFINRLAEQNFQVLLPKFSHSGAEIRFEE